ncbi:response regulator [Methylomonas methanica]|uniref:Two component transcriptional regulator, winged helix family n=1 Tax=Methylomonas methanica (strain DSM 25384 / MC09) TaxID=857087 RepID=F9ZWS0_METMM|nr:response regulator [Methylomonas methanica]AEG02082.1 two component transcriptional regulator, winged helix family [Methylomonas methanica MC09]
MTQISRILIVEDEQKLAKLAADYLQNAGFATEILSHGDAVLPWVKQQHPELILLDLMLPGRDGLAICREIRNFSQVPIIMVTARVEEIDRLLGLEMGADDYICKPYSPREMVARVKAVLRRLQPQTSPENSAGLLALDSNSFRVLAEGREIELTAVEFQLLQALYRQPGHIFSRSRLMDLVYPDQRIVSDRTIDSHIKKLRKKLAELLPGHELIHSVYGAGYRYDRQPAGQD